MLFILFIIFFYTNKGKIKLFLTIIILIFKKSHKKISKLKITCKACLIYIWLNISMMDKIIVIFHVEGFHENTL